LTPIATALVLLAALLHASWNAVLRGGRDRLWSMSVMCLGIGLPALAALPFVPRPAAASWPFVLASGVLHLGYNLGLVRMYRLGSLGETYPIARGSAPMLVALGAALFAHELPNALALAGIGLVSCGIFALAVQGRRLAGVALAAALVTGLVIATYTVVDGLGVRRAGTDAGYIAWIFGLELALVPVFIGIRGASGLAAPARAFVAPLLGGVVSLVAYGIVIVALAAAPMGPVAALRETSVVFASLIGWMFLKEPLTVWRLAACVVIAAGAFCLGVAH
jgi:drug/metabolite transporter (DMT)-like permease